MKAKHLIILMIAGSGLTQKVFGQSEYIGVLPMQYIPSFAGSTGNPRLIAMGGYRIFHDRYQPTISYPYEKTKIATLSFDHFIPKIASGIGGSFTYLNYYRPEVNTSLKPNTYFVGKYENSDTLRKYQNALNASIVLSPKISLRGKYTIAPALQLNYKYINFTENFYRYNRVFIDSSTRVVSKISLTASILFNAKKYYAGLAICSRGFYFPQFDSFFSGGYMEGKTRTFALLQGGYTFQRKETSKFSFTPQIVYFIPSYLFSISNLEYTLKFRYKKVIWGIGGGGGLFAGYQNDKFSLILGQRLRFSKSDILHYHGEISVRYSFKSKNKTVIGG